MPLSRLTWKMIILSDILFIGAKNDARKCNVGVQYMERRLESVKLPSELRW